MGSLLREIQVVLAATAKVFITQGTHDLSRIDVTEATVCQISNAPVKRKLRLLNHILSGVLHN